MEHMTSKELPISKRQSIELYRFGTPDGKPVLYHHGVLASGAEAAPLHKLAKELGWDLIAPSREGVGKSTFHPNRTLKDWPETAQRILDRLSIQEVDALSYSGGGPYNFALGHAVDTRVKTMTVIASPSNFQSQGVKKDMHATDAMFLWLLENVPMAAKAILWWRVHNFDNHAYVEEVRSRLPKEEQDALKDPKKRAIVVQYIRDAMKQKVRGLHKELEILNTDWGFDAGEIKPNIPLQIIHGAKDKTIPLLMHTKLKEALPHAKTHILEESGHGMNFIENGPMHQVLFAKEQKLLAS